MSQATFGAGSGRDTSLVFVGFMGAGKTTWAREASGLLGWPAVDLDEALEHRAGKPIARVFAEDGEAVFRAAEERLALELLGNDQPRVLALGGGAVTSPAVRQALVKHLVVWLDIGLEQAWQRCRDGERPLARDQAAFARLYEHREPLYAETADVIVPADETVDLEAVLAAACELAPPTRLLWSSGPGGGHAAYIGGGLLAEPAFWPRRLAGRRFLVSDRTVAQLYAQRLEPFVHRAVMAEGEQSKTLETATIVWKELAAAGMTRSDLLIALGGGVVGDLAGFCAATYQRGVRYVQVPTTLVAQVDSAYGGKTGVDLPAGKNYVGVYHQPAAVLADPLTLATLPEAELSAGFAEVVKTALIAGGWLWERIRSGADPCDPEIITGCAHTKLRVVARDERDGGPRQMLNLGHTIGHAIEAASGYGRYRHGEAVALGLLAALRMSGAGALREEVRGLLSSRGLPTRLEGVAVDDVVEATGRDKKRLGEAPVPFVLVDGPGRVRTGCPVGVADVRAAVRELAA